MKLMELLKSEDYLILDTETTGVDTNAEIVQLAIITARGEVLMNELVKPVELIPIGATNIHGITNEMVADKRSFPYQEVFNLLNGKQVVVYNADFDSAMLYRSTKAVTQTYIDWHRIATWHCAMKEFARIYGDYNYQRKSFRWQKLSKALAYYNLPTTKAHDALGDCLDTLAVCKAMIGTRPVVDDPTQAKLPF